MLITNHVLQGALVGTLAPGPGSAFALGIASHVVADALPHWGDQPLEEVMHVAVADGLIGLGTMAWVLRRTPPERRQRVFAGMAGACLPDADKPAGVFFGVSPFPAVVDRFHAVIQRESRHRKPQEIACAVVAALVVRRLSRG